MAKSNPSGASFDAQSSQLQELIAFFDAARIQRISSAVLKLKQDSDAIIAPLRAGIGGGQHSSFHIDRPTLKDSITAAMFSHTLTIITGKPGVGKSVAVKNCLAATNTNLSTLIFRADQFNQPHLSNVMNALGIHDSLPDIFSSLALQPDKIIFIDSMEKLLENADPDSAFKQLLNIAERYKINIISTSRTYAVELLIQKFGIDPQQLKILEVPLLTDEQLNQAVAHFPALADAVKNVNIRSLLQSPKYLDFTVKAIGLHPNDFSSASLIEFKNKLWDSLVCNVVYRKSGLPAKREKAFLEIAENRARQMVLFAKPQQGDAEAIDLLENDDIIFQDGTKRKYAPSHDILEDWALTRLVSATLEDSRDVSSFFKSLGNEPAIRRAFRLWVEDQLLDGTQKTMTLIKDSLSDASIESYWSDELLVAVFKSDNSAPFFSQFETTLLGNKALLLNRCMHIIKTTCKETNYDVGEKPILMPVGSGWEQLLLFLQKHLSSLNHLRPAILDFLYDWDFRLIFDYPKDKPELQAAKQIVLFYIRQAEKKNEFWDNRSSASNKKMLVTMLFNLALIAKEEITDLVKQCLSKREARNNFHSDKIHDLVLKIICYGPAKYQMAYALPDLILEALITQWKYVPPKPRDKEEKTIFKSFRPSMDKEQCWGIYSNFGFSPSGIFKTPVYSISQFHPFKAITFIISFINYSVSHYVKADCGYKHEISEIEVVFPDGTKVKQWAAWEFWVAFRGISVTDYLLESLLMTLEKLLFDMAANSLPSGKEKIKTAFDYILRKSNNVMPLGVLSSVTIAYPVAVGDSFLPLLHVKEIYHWDYHRAQREHSTFAMYDEEIPSAQKIRYDSNQLEHRKKHHDGFGGFLIDYQFTVRTYNSQIFAILDKLWMELGEDDITWKKKLHEIDSRKWKITDHQPEIGQFMIQPGYDEEVAALIDTGKPQMDAANLAARNSQALSKVLAATEQIDYSKWVEYFNYYSTRENFDTRFDKPVTFAVIGVRDFPGQLTEEQKGWCIRHITTTIGHILGSLRSFDFDQPFLYNYMEQETALESLHLLFSIVTDKEDLLELTFLTGVVLSSPFHDTDREKLNTYFRDVFAKELPETFYKVWNMLVQLAGFKKKNPYYYDDPDRKRYEIARNKEFEFIEKTCKSSTVLEIDFPKLSFENSEAFILANALLIIPVAVERTEYASYLVKFLELLSNDLPLDTDHDYLHSKGKQIHHQAVFAIEKHLALILLYTDVEFARQVLELLIPISKITSDSYYHHGDPMQFVLRTLDQVIYQLDDFTRSSNELEKQYAIVNRFWSLWDHLLSNISIEESPYFSKVLLFDTEYSWSSELRNAGWLVGKSERYSQIMQLVGPSSVPSAIKIFCTIGSAECLPFGISWVVTLLRMNIHVLEKASVTSLNQLIKLLYSENINVIKKDQRLITDFLWLLDRLVEKGNSTAYLYRENVIVYKKST